MEMKARGWEACDIILVSGDAYCDHPSFGTALLGRLLEDEGYKVGIISQPDWKKEDDFKRLGAPRLFFGVTAGNLDSMINIYTASHAKRREDRYAPGGARGLRPAFPTIVYTNKLRQLFPQTPIVIGGIEASLRRLAHYDFWSDKVRRSILFDAKADILVYGMGERAILEIARRLNRGDAASALDEIRGTVVARKDVSHLKGLVELPSFEDVMVSDFMGKKKFLEAFLLYSKETNPVTAHPVAQKMDTRYAVQYPPALPLSSEEMDRLYALPFTRRCHPSYDRFGGVPALATVVTSITSHRGCAANCSFCSLSFHQGRAISSRSRASIAKEASLIAEDKSFKGTISDVGGPTANMYGAACGLGHRCAKEDCLWPEICPNFLFDPDEQMRILEEVRTTPNVKRVNIQSGVRYDLLLHPKARRYFEEICRYYVSGQLKIAPEHVNDKVLKLMRKPSFALYKRFVQAYEAVNKKIGKKQFLAQYFITAHPGCTLKDARELAAYTKTLGYTPEQVQDFIPLPMTRSSVMYHTGLNPDTGEPLFTARTREDRLIQRRMVQSRDASQDDAIED
jgi:uncharacterized radical SAM protein YgiQ